MKQAIVFGGSGGIGQALLDHLVKKYANIHIVVPLRASSKTPEISHNQSQKIDFINWDPKEEQTLIDGLAPYSDQRFDLCLSAIGALHTETLTPEKKLAQLDIDHFLWSYECNAVSHAMILKHIAPKMNKKEPSIMGFLSARVGSIGDNKLGGWYSYRAAKAALNMIIKTASIEMKRYNKNLSIVGIHPGTVNTNLSEPFQSHVPEHKLFTPEQSADYIFDNIIDKVTVEDSGHVFAWDGEKNTE